MEQEQIENAQLLEEVEAPQDDLAMEVSKENDLDKTILKENSAKKEGGALSKTEILELEKSRTPTLKMVLQSQNFSQGSKATGSKNLPASKGSKFFSGLGGSQGSKKSHQFSPKNQGALSKKSLREVSGSKSSLKRVTNGGTLEMAELCS